MKRLILFLFLTASITGYGQQQDEDFKIVFIPNEKDNINRVTIGYQHNGELVQHHGELTDGEFIITGKVPEIKSGDLVMFKKKGKGFTISIHKFILEPKTITIERSGHTTTFKGTPLQEDYTKYYTLVGKIRSQIDEKEKMLNVFQKSGDIFNFQQTSQEIDVLMKQKQKVLEKRFETKGNPWIVAFALEEYVTPEWKNLEKAQKFYKALPENLLNMRN